MYLSSEQNLLNGFEYMQTTKAKLLVAILFDS